MTEVLVLRLVRSMWQMFYLNFLDAQKNEKWINDLMMSSKPPKTQQTPIPVGTKATGFHTQFQPKCTLSSIVLITWLRHYLTKIHPGTQKPPAALKYSPLSRPYAGALRNTLELPSVMQSNMNQTKDFFTKKTCSIYFLAHFTCKFSQRL